MKYAIGKQCFKSESGAALQFFLAPIAIGALLGVSYYLFACPCERMPGGYLIGQEVSEKIEDWSFVNQTGLCQIQVAAVLPHSLNLKRETGTPPAKGWWSFSLVSRIKSRD